MSKGGTNNNLQTAQARRKQNCIGLAYWYLYPSVYVSMYADSKGVWGYAPPRKILCCEMAPEAILGPKRHYYSSL